MRFAFAVIAVLIASSGCVPTTRTAATQPARNFEATNLHKARLEAAASAAAEMVAFIEKDIAAQGITDHRVARYCLWSTRLHHAQRSSDRSEADRNQESRLRWVAEVLKRDADKASRIGELIVNYHFALIGVPIPFATPRHGAHTTQPTVRTPTPAQVGAELFEVCQMFERGGETMSINFIELILWSSRCACESQSSSDPCAAHVSHTAEYLSTYRNRRWFSPPDKDYFQTLNYFEQIAFDGSSVAELALDLAGYAGRE